MNNMKNASRRITVVFLAVLVFVSTALLTACKQEPMVIKDSDTYIVIKVTQEAMGDRSEMLLIDYMKQLKDKGDLAFEMSDGMITSINGIANPADYSSCWMLYTSDETMSNAAWGTVEYQGKQYGSAVVGAEQMKIKPGQLYIWVYQSF